MGAGYVRPPVGALVMEHHGVAPGGGSGERRRPRWGLEVGDVTRAPPVGAWSSIVDLGM